MPKWWWSPRRKDMYEARLRAAEMEATAHKIKAHTASQATRKVQPVTKNKQLIRQLTGRGLIAQNFPIAVGARDSNRTNFISNENKQKMGQMKDLELVKLLGSGVSGQVWLAHDNVSWWALKYVKFNMPFDTFLFRQEAHYQKMFAAIKCAPLVEDAWMVARPAAGVLKMQPIDGVVSDVIRRHEFDPPVLKYIAAQTFRLCATLASRGLVHGDPHFQNIAIEMSPDRHTPNLLFIDFGRSFQIPQAFPEDEANPDLLEYLLDADKFWIWRATMFDPVINPYLQDVGFPGSMIMKKIFGDSRPQVTQDSALTQLSEVSDSYEIQKLSRYQALFKQSQTDAQLYVSQRA